MPLVVLDNNFARPEEWFNNAHVRAFHQVSEVQVCEFRYLPFVSLPLTGFFPATLTLYWCSLSFVQAALMVAINTKYIQNKYVLHKEVVQPQIVRAVFVEEKPKQGKV